MRGRRAPFEARRASAWLLLTAAVVAGGALAQAPDDEAAGAPEDPSPPDELAPPPPASGREVVAGDIVDGWVVIAVQSPPRLPDGRATEELCGWVRDLLVLKQAAPSGAEPEPATLQVPCVRGARGLEAGAVRILPKRQPQATPAGDPLPEAPTPSAPAAADEPFLPEDITTLDSPPSPASGPVAFEGPKDEKGRVLTGVVLLEVSVDKRGRVRRARRVETTLGDGSAAGAAEQLDKLAIEKAEALTFTPGFKAGVPVDAVAPLEVRFTDGAPGAPVVLDYKTDWWTLDGPDQKGELSELGSIQLKNPLNSVGVGFGFAYIDDVAYLSVRPNLDLHIGPFSIGLGTPLRFQVFDTRPVVGRLRENFVYAAETETYTAGLVGVGTFRFKDWDRFIAFPFSDILRPIRYITWGTKEQYIYVDVNRTNPITIGHGQLVRRYMPNVDIDESNFFAVADAYYHFGGVELMAGPLPVPRLFGGLVFIKPLGLFLDDTFSRSWSVGLSYITDINAPAQLAKSPHPRTQLLQYVIDESQFVHTHRDQVAGWQVQGFGVDSEIKVVKWRFLDVKVYADYSHLLFPGVPEADIEPFMGGGATAGTLVRLSFGSTPVHDPEDEPEEVKKGLAPQERRAVHAFRLRAEAKVFSPQYLPSYWSSLYEADKYQLGFGALPQPYRGLLPTKIGHLAAQASDPYRFGWYVEGTYTLIDWFAVTAVYEDAVKLWGELATVPAARNLILHVETQGLGWLQLFATYHYRNFEFVDWARLLNVGSDNELIYVGGRLSVLFLAFNFGVQRGLRVDFLEGDGLGGPRDVGNKLLPHSSVGLQNQWAFAGDVEVGWNW